jgi:hypothetical protein
MVKARMTTADVAAEIACLRKLIGMRVANVYDLNPKASLLECCIFSPNHLCLGSLPSSVGGIPGQHCCLHLKHMHIGGVSYMAPRNQHWRCKILPSFLPWKLKGHGGVHCQMLFTVLGGKVSGLA